jgi:hypothetical protein
MHGPMVRCTRSSTSVSNFARDSLMSRCLGACLVGRDERQVDARFLGRGQFDLGLLCGLAQALQRQAVVAQVDALLFLELVGEVVDDSLVEVLAAQERVAVGRLDLEDPVADVEDRDVERAAAEIVDGDLAGLLLVEAIGEGRRRRLVDDAHHLETGDLAGILGRLALGIVEIGRHGDDRLFDLFAEMALRRLLHLLQDEGGNLRGRVFLAAGLHPGVAVVAAHDLVGHQRLVLLDDGIVEATADQALDGEDGVLWVGHGLALRCLADQDLAVLAERDHGGRRPRAFGVFDHLCLPAFHHGDTGIGRSQIDADHLGHVRLRCCRVTVLLNTVRRPATLTTVNLRTRRVAVRRA